MKKLLTLVLVLGICLPCFAGDLHLIIFADTYDGNIGYTCRIDRENMLKQARQIEEYTDLTARIQVFDGSKFTKSNANSVLSSLQCTPEDVILFYYTGHGYNSGGKKWPMMNTRGGALSFYNVIDSLKGKNARLVLILADCCNNRGQVNLSPLELAESRYARKESYQKLFLQSRGHIYSSGCEPGEYSWCNTSIGGFFTYAFLESMDYYTKSENPEWRDLLTKTRKRAAQISGGEQHPQFECSLTDVVEAIAKK